MFHFSEWGMIGITWVHERACWIQWDTAAFEDEGTWHDSPITSCGQIATQTKPWQTCFKFLENAMFLLIARPSWILFPPSEIIQSYLSNSTTWKTSTQLRVALPQSPFHCTWLCAFPKHTKLLLHSNCHNYDTFAFTVFLFSVSAFLYTR